MHLVIVYLIFAGSGTKVMSKSCQFVLGDEVDQYQPPPNVNQIKEMKKRTRSYDHSIVGLVCTPTKENGTIWKEYLAGSQGKWYLRCKGCGQLTMRSCDIKNLQFESDYIQKTKSRIVKPETIRLICPKCGYQHVEADKAWMNQNGGYIHKVPQRLETDPSFQLGALASQLPSMSWTKIATAQLESGKRNSRQVHITFDNSYRGLPYKQRVIQKDEVEKISQHFYRSPSQKLKSENIQFVFGAVDSMGSYWRYAISN